MKLVVQFSAILDGVVKKKDGTLSVRLGTQELTPMDTAQIFEFGNKQIWCAMADVPLEHDDLNIPETMTEFRNDKSPSQRLRNTLYIYWGKNLKDKEEWENFYKRKVEQMIEYIKEKLE